MHNKLLTSCLLLIVIFSSVLLNLSAKERVFTDTEFQDSLKDNSSGPVMIQISPGQFIMGDPDQKGQSYERPAHKVTISYSFAIGKYPVTFEEYDAFTKATGRPSISDYNWGRKSRPVINVNIVDANAYASWLTTQTGHTYRLPSEAEWEYAARAGTTSIYPWGNKIGKNNANCSGCGSSWDKKSTAPVGQFPANAWGLHDTQGNTWDITADCWNYNYDNAPTDGSAWKDGDCLRGVIRGGSLGDIPRDLRSSTRLRNYSTTRTIIIGFRLVREM
ncbi:MAG: formylglycine-generating enzyme family protein [Gammaproteobacteria bacterium]|nr:formylglycine-generating enzyme family protein [Gammaproteobacteria bacterium]